MTGTTMRNLSLAFLLSWAASSEAADITFTSDGAIGDAESYERVWIYDSPPAHTTIEMLAGGVTTRSCTTTAP